MPLPPFDEAGNLPPGIYEVTWQEFVDLYGRNEIRRALLDGMLRALRSLKNAGCKVAWIDGSFVSAKDFPGDYDLCYEVDVNAKMELTDPVIRDFRRYRDIQRERYEGELFPARGIAGLGPDGSIATFLTFFQYDRRQKRAKGIVRISLSEMSTA